MPMPQKRRRRRRRSPGSGSSRRRIGEELSGSVVKSEINSTAYGADRGVSFPRYKLLLTSRLDGLELPPSADGDDPGSFYRPDHPSDEILKALTRRSFLDDEMLDALVEYQIQKCLIDETQGQDSGEFHSASETHGRASGNFDSADVAMASVDLGDDICDEDFLKDCEKLWSSATPVGAKLNNRRQDELYLRHARFRIKAFLLLKGKTIDKMDDAALDRKYPPNLVAEHSYFLDYDRYDLFGWFFDSDLCKLASLTDYQRAAASPF
uniref:Uncharacterized protein n=1 Tax=Avena sativa TaxID=4498 RepID=A0ACD5THG2_AVESA